MSKQTLVNVFCDGCGRSTLHDGIDIVRSRLRYYWQEAGQTVDLCFDCQGADKYICRLCGGVHDDDHPCEAVAKRMDLVTQP